MTFGFPPTSFFARCLGVLALAGAAFVPTTGAALNEGSRAPEIGLSATSGEAIRIGSLRGKVVVVDFFASWCEPCREEMPVLQRLYDRYRGRGLVVVGVSVDTDERAMRDFVRRVNVRFPIVHDRSHAVANRYRPSPMPSSYFVDRNGIVRFVQRGFRSRDARSIESKIAGLIES